MAVRKETAKRVANELKKAGVSFHTDVGIGGAKPDFLIEGPKGHEFVLDLKNWKPTPAYLERAREQVVHYTDSVGADGAFVIVEGLKNSQPERGLLAPDDVGEIVRTVLTESGAKKARKRRKRERTETPFVFAAMPFHKRYQDTFWFGMVPAAEKAGAVCERLDTAHFSGEILQTMKKWIRKSAAVIADLSGSNPNVMFELGYAHALNKAVIQLTSTPVKDLPFDARTWPTLEYEIGAVSDLAPDLAKRLKEILR